MNSTGNKCTTSGIYCCSIHPSYTINIQRGDTFPPCREGVGGGHDANWILLSVR